MAVIIAFYAALLVPIFIVLALRVIVARRSEKVGVGDGGKAKVLRRMRAHANFAEYVPYALVLMGLAETLQSPVWLLHACGNVLFLGRAVHAYGISQMVEIIVFRQIGMVATFIVFIGLASACLLKAVPALF